MDGLVFLLLIWAGAILAAHYLGVSRGRTGWLWGFLLGWLGVIILACMGKKQTPEQLELTALEQQVRLAELRKQVNQIT
jgi:hypothetical protein